MTRIGKIARLPRDVRNELNQRIDNGEQGTHLVAWLNGLPAVKGVLAECFEGREINDQNLSDWKTGGFQDWLAHQEALNQARTLNENTAELAVTASGPMVDNLAMVLGLRTAAVLAEWQGEVTEEYERKLRALRKLSLLVMGLRRSQHAAMRMEMELIEIKSGINDQIRRTQDDEFARPPYDALYEHLWRMSGHKFGQMDLEEEVPHASSSEGDEDETVPCKGRAAEAQGRKHRTSQAPKGRKPGTSNVEASKLEKGRGQDIQAVRCEPHGLRRPSTSNAQHPKRERVGKKPRTLNVEPSNVEQQGDQNTEHPTSNAQHPAGTKKQEKKPDIDGRTLNPSLQERQEMEAFKAIQGNSSQTDELKG